MNKFLSQKQSASLRKELTINERIDLIQELNGSINTLNDILGRKRKLCSSYLPHFKVLTKKALINNEENRKILIEFQELLNKNL